MNIGGRQIGPDHPPYIIAEIGVNHDGEVERALELADAAAEAGADAVKFQYFRTDLLMSRAAKLAAYQRAAGETDPIEMLRRLELDIHELAQVVQRAHEHEIHAIVTPFSVELVDELEPLGWDAFKTASPDVVHKPLLERLVSTGRPMIVSTGASTMEEVERAVGWLEPARGRLALLQCVSCYPTEEKDMALDGIEALRRALPGLSIGYSDHTRDHKSGWSAVIAGADLLEKHITDDRHRTGPDHRASLLTAQLDTYRVIANNGMKRRPEGMLWRRWMEEGRPRTRETMLGFAAATSLKPGDAWLVQWAMGTEPFVKRVLDCECDVREVSRQSIVTTRALDAGHVVARDDLTFKRPGTGFEPWRLGKVVGRTTAHAIDADVPITAEDLA